MARKKKTPRKSVSVNDKPHNPENLEDNSLKASEEEVEEKPYFVNVDRANWDASQHKDLSEIVLIDLKIVEDFVGFELNEEFYNDSSCNMRFRLSNVSEYPSRLVNGKWPIFSLEQICLELGQKMVLDDNKENYNVIVSGSFDGPDEGVSGLVHLISLQYLTLRPVLGVKLVDRITSLRLRVEILEGVFSSCESLTDSNNQFWKKSMMNVMAWLRPEVMTSEAKYGVRLSSDMEFSTDLDDVNKKDARFEVARFYEAIKPSKNYPVMEDELPNLTPELRPYQLRAVRWMVERERTASGVLENHQNSPLCVAVKLLDTDSSIFYNPFSGSFSIYPENPSSQVFGGILADEMGLGKTVELLGCVFSHQRSASEASCFSDNVLADNHEKIGLKRLKMERVECVCGAVTESIKYKGLWVQCDICDAWQHGDCVDYSPSGRSKKCEEPEKTNNKRKRNAMRIAETDGEYICRLCLELIQVTKSPVASGATLIVCPTPILAQWHAEINRHTVPGSLTTLIYEGVREASLSESRALSVGELIDADIVLTTYDILKADLSHDSERHEGDRRLMRYKKRYPVIPTPLTRIYWWRVCLDEAQMVESSTTAATEMALRLHAKYRWCITGTPIQSKLDDLYGLLKFLKASPFDVLRWWTDVIRQPYERGDTRAMEFTHVLFRHIMWRSSKESVADELKLPPQEECLSWLSFSAIEEHFYQRQHESCVTIARELLASLKSDIHKRNDAGDASDFVITHFEASKLLNSLLKLRQACCHPQVGSSGLRSIQQSPMSMDEILTVLVSKTKVEGEDAIRKVVSSLNGLAGIAIIRSELSHAVQLYKEALALAEEHAEEFRLDPLLNLHIHYNLAEILKTRSQMHLIEEDNEHVMSERDTMEEHISDKKVDGMEPDVLCRTYSNEDLLKECENIKEKYLCTFYSRLSQAQHDFQKSYTQVCDAHRNKKHHETWWLDALHQIKQNKEAANELTAKIENAVLRSRDVTKSSKSTSHLRNITSLEYHLQTGLDSLENSRKKLLDRLLEVDHTMDHPRDEDVERIRYCPKCYDNMDGPLCVHCELDDLFEDYEARLFLLKGDSNGRTLVSAEEAINQKWKKSELNKKREFGKKLEVSRMPSELEIILGVLRSYFKSQLGRDSTSSATEHLLLLESMRKEYPHARTLATAQAQIFRAHDEIKMATSRLRLRDNADDTSIDAISLEELDIASVENSSEKFVSLASLTRIRGKLRYLQGLVKSKQKIEVDSPQVLPHKPSKNENKVDDEICPVCQEKLLDQRMVFECGHATCCKCLFAMSAQRQTTKWVMCPTCRQHSDFDNVAFADDGKHASTDLNCNSFDAFIRVRGSYGTKIEAVTRRILWIKSKESEAKVLVFSSWNDVLDVLEHAFAANQISYVRMKGGRKSQDSISIFKGQKSAKSVQVLLILVQHGANGLNLLEAQHVILVEPLLNPAAEAQAISRVHRIGQHKKTLIHRFMVKGSVEESIYKLNKSRNASSFVNCNKKKNHDQLNLTLKDVESLFSSVQSMKNTEPELKEDENGSLNHLPPSMAAAVAADRRLNEHRTLVMVGSCDNPIRQDNELVL
ncbi:hypothetical protein V2J09_012129 [Rumex salicifolius]